MSLHLPRPSSSSSSAPPTPTAPPTAVSAAAAGSAGDVLMSPPSAPSVARLPPRNFVSTSTSHSAHALARSAARDLRAATKSPFVPKKKAASPLGAANGTASMGGLGAGNGKERDLSGLSIEDLEDMLLRNKEVLESPMTLSLLPGGSTKLLASQTRIAARLNELKQMRNIRDELEKTHLEEQGSVKVEEDEDVKPTGIKTEDGEVKMEDITDAPHTADPAELATSPYTKKRLASRPSGPQSPHSLTSTISLSESIALQQAAVNRQREAARRREEKQAAVERSMGGRVKGAMGDSKVGEFMFHPDSDEEDDDSDVDLDFLSSSKLSLGGMGLTNSTSNATGGVGGGGAEFSLSGQLDDEEDSQLNPYRVAYESGWHRANEEMESDIKAGGGREIRP